MHDRTEVAVEREENSPRNVRRYQNGRISLVEGLIRGIKLNPDSTMLEVSQLFQNTGGVYDRDLPVPIVNQPFRQWHPPLGVHRSVLRCIGGRPLLEWP